MFKKAGKAAERLFRKSNASRQATITAVEGSVTVTTSGTNESRENSAPASRNVLEVVKKLDDILTALGTPDGGFPIDQTLLDTISSQAEKYPNHKLSSDGNEWTCSDEMKTTIMLAANAAEAAYGRNAHHDLEFLKRVGLIAVEDKTYPSSFEGSIKQLAIRAFVRTQTPLDANGDQTLIIAIKGSASFVDWITNLNGDPVESSFVSAPGAEVLAKVHNGLLRATMKLEPKVREIIEQHIATTNSLTDSSSRPRQRIVLTGHSAGGGVAALLYLHYLNHNKIFTDSDMLCITFAAPPVIDNGPRKLQPGFLSFVNEGDPVPRMDKGYTQSMVDLYRFSKTPVSDDGTVLNQWTPPSPQLRVPTESLIIILHIMKEDDSGFEMKLCHCPSTAFEQTLALDFEQHHMRWYLKEIDGWVNRSGDNK